MQLGGGGGGGGPVSWGPSSWLGYREVEGCRWAAGEAEERGEPSPPRPAGLVLQGAAAGSGSDGQSPGARGLSGRRRQPCAEQFEFERLCRLPGQG